MRIIQKIAIVTHRCITNQQLTGIVYPSNALSNNVRPPTGKSVSVFLLEAIPLISSAKLMNKGDHEQHERLLEFKIKIIRLLVFVRHTLRNQ